MNRSKYSWPSLVGVLMAVSVFTRQVTLAQNYEDPYGPKFAGDFAQSLPAQADDITVVSYNIKYGQGIAEAQQELTEIDSLRDADVILLQEMDESGTAQLAKSLGYNYIYIPAAIHPKYQKNFGNAILSKWPMSQPEKLVLPHKSLTRYMVRQATKAMVTLNGIDILVYSVHAETAFSVPRYRWNQYQEIINDINAQADYVVVGGDFNTITRGEVDQLEARFAAVGLTRASNGVGHTVNKLAVPMMMDHIFTKGFAVKDTGKVVEAAASDHLPIWVELRWDDGNAMKTNR